MILAAEWAAIESEFSDLQVSDATCIIKEVELVAYDDEYEVPAGIYALTGRDWVVKIKVQAAVDC